MMPLSSGHVRCSCRYGRNCEDGGKNARQMHISSKPRRRLSLSTIIHLLWDVNATQMQIITLWLWWFLAIVSGIMSSVLWHCWLGGRKGIRPAKKWGDGGGGHWLVRTEWCPAGWSVCLPVLIFPCTIKSRSSLLAPAHPGGPGKRLWCGFRDQDSVDIRDHSCLLTCSSITPHRHMLSFCLMGLLVWSYSRLRPVLQKVEQTEPFNGLFFRTVWVSWHQKGQTKPIKIIMKQETMW